MVKTLDSVMTFLALLIIFIFTVSILGMHLFGAKMIHEGTPVRHNFDSLLWALMTTFQVRQLLHMSRYLHVRLYNYLRLTIAEMTLYPVIIIAVSYTYRDCIFKEINVTDKNGILISLLKGVYCRPIPMLHTL